MEQSILTKTDYEYNLNAIKSLGAAFFFYAGSYSVKPIFRTLGLASMESVGALCFYIIWAIHIYRALCIGTKLKLSLFLKIVFWDLAFVFILYINKVLFPNTAQYYAEYMMFFRQIVLVFIPCGVLISQVYDFSEAFKILRRYAWYGSIIMMVSLCFGYLSYWDYQYWGVQLSPFILILACSYVETRKHTDLILAIIDTALLMLGGRQSLVVVVMGLLLLYIFNNRNKSVKMLVIVSVVTVASVMLVSGAYITIFQVINSIFNSMGIYMEALERIASGNMFSTSTRDIIYEYSFLTIANNGSKISGILSDRYYLRHIGQYNSWIQYPHNIYLELLIDFGSILGLILSVVLTWKVIKVMFLYGSDDRKRIGILICSITMVRLFVSSSFIIEGSFFIMLGLIMGMGTRFSWGKRI